MRHKDPTKLPISHLKGVGSQVAERLARLGVHSVGDLLLHLPLRYQDRTRIVPIRELQPGDDAVVQGVVTGTEIKSGRGKRMFLCALEDDTGVLVLRFFHFHDGLRKQMQMGTVLRCYGEVRAGYDTIEMTHPELRRVDAESPPPTEQALTPVYPTTEGLGQNQLRKLAAQALEFEMSDPFPPAVRERYQLPGIDSALRLIHRPPPGSDTDLLGLGLHPAQRRLAFEELLAHHLSLRVLRHHAEQHRAPPLDPPGESAEKLLAHLPFQLTGAQQRVVEEIRVDLRQAHPMQRLVQGDVGSGKTVVAALAALQAVDAGYQVALMAPTELLAEQHRRTFGHWLQILDIEPHWLAGSSGKRHRDKVLAALADGGAQVIVGTHALFQESVQFHALGLVIVDEQHRFGVHQRLTLRDKGRNGDRYPHQLIMTATPIPRTLAMTAYADLDMSIIDELPPGRSPVTTVAVPDTRRDEVIRRVADACLEGRQAYWVCPLIEESEALQCQAAEDTAAHLRESLPGVRTGLVHGRLKSADKDAVMNAFKNGEVDLLVATTVIEVGVDVPNATLMIIENPERMGLAQLHQLRGRVGRGAQQSYCVLLYHHPLTESGKVRLGVLRETQDGFVIARKDLELRGPGEVLGTRQTGLAQFRIADLERDQDLLPQVAEAAGRLLQEAPEQVPELIRAWLREGMAYGNVV